MRYNVTLDSLISISSWINKNSYPCLTISFSLWTLYADVRNISSIKYVITIMNPHYVIKLFYFISDVIWFFRDFSSRASFSMTTASLRNKERYVQGNVHVTSKRSSTFNQNVITRLNEVLRALNQAKSISEKYQINETDVTDCVEPGSRCIKNVNPRAFSRLFPHTGDQKSFSIALTRNSISRPGSPCQSHRYYYRHLACNEYSLSK